MMRIHNTAILILAFVGWLGPHPAPAVSRQYQLGTTYEYEYETLVQLNENPVSGREVGFKVIAQVSLTNVWQNSMDPSERLMKLELSKPKLQVHSVNTKDHHLQDHVSALDKAVSQAAYVHWSSGRPNKIYLPTSAAGKDDPAADLLRGLAGLFQVHAGESDSSDTVQEDGVSGRCHVSYIKKSGTTLEKRKWGCVHPQTEQFSHHNYLQSVTTDSRASYLYELFPDASVKNVMVSEKVQMTVNLWRKASLQIRSDSRLSFRSERTQEPTVQAADVNEAVKALTKKVKLEAANLASMSAVAKGECSGSKCKPLNTVVKEYRERLKTENLAKVKSANAFLRVLENMRVASQKDIESVLKDTKNKKVLPQLLDVVAAAQTQAALAAGLAVVDFNNVDQAERFLLCLGLASHPSEHLLNQLLILAKKPVSNEKVQVTLLTTLGNLARTFCLQKGDGQECGRIVQGLRDYLVNNLEACKEDFCRLFFLRGLVNAGIPDTAPTLIPYIIKGGKLGAVALRAMKRIGSHRLNETTVRVLVEVYHQLRRQYDTTCRTLAAEVLLGVNGKKHSIVRDLIYSLSNQQTPEVNTFALAKLLEMAETDPQLGASLRQVVNDHSVWNYYTLAQNGVSAAYTRPFGESTGANATYGINMEFLPGGVLKRSSFDVAMQSENVDPLLLLSVGLYAEGIGSFGGGGGEDDNEAEKEETSAGMELAAFDMRIRPYTFFTGTGELMGLVWSGTGSEPTPALQANILMNDHQQTTALHNGLPVELSLTGGLSAELMGSIQISLWNRNSHSLVKTSGALLLHGAARISTPFAKAHLEFAMGGEAYVDFVTDLDFYAKPFKMCIQMDQKPFSFRYNVRKSESVPGSKHLVRTLRRRTSHVNGKSFAMHKKNLKTCSVMLEEA